MKFRNCLPKCSLSYFIADGLALGLISYPNHQSLQRARNRLTYVIAALLLYFVFERGRMG